MNSQGKCVTKCAITLQSIDAKIYEFKNVNLIENPLKLTKKFNFLIGRHGRNKN